jgi:hypothetical protein
VSWRGSKQERHPRIRSARRGVPFLSEEDFVFIIGIDPHKGSHTAAVIDGDEQLVGEMSVCADRRQRDRLLAWAAPFEPRLWAVEGATGHGALLAHQLVASGEHVVDVPAALSARARLLDSGRKDKTDGHDARSAAVVALRHRNLRTVALEDHRQALRLLARRHHQLTAARTRAICRLHAVLCEMIAGGLSKNLSAKRASEELRKVRPRWTLFLLTRAWAHIEAPRRSAVSIPRPRNGRSRHVMPVSSTSSVWSGRRSRGTRCGRGAGRVARVAGYVGSPRNFRRLVAVKKRAWRAVQGQREHRPGVWLAAETISSLITLGSPSGG